MTTYLTARKLVTKIRRRIGDEDQGSSGLTTWSDTDILDAVDSVFESVSETVRFAYEDHEIDRMDLAVSDFTETEKSWYEYALPEYVRSIRWVEGVDANGTTRLFQPYEFADIETRAYARMGGAPRWSLTRWGRPGTFSITGNLTAGLGTVRVWFIRRYPTLHWGTADPSSSAGSLVFDATPTAGEVRKRDDLYIGMHVINEDTDSLAQITDYVGSTQTATITPAEDWSSNEYSLVLPLEPEINEYFVQLVAAHFFMRSGNDQQIATMTGEIRRLMDRARATLSRRKQGQPQHFINTRVR